MLKKICIILLAIVCLFTCACDACGSSSQESLYYDPMAGIDKSEVLSQIAENGESSYVIVTASNATQSEKYAATEFQTYVQKVSGAILPVKDERMLATGVDGKYISIGQTQMLSSAEFEIDYSSLNGDGFVLKTKGDDLYIVGASDRGTIYGVYDFLEKICGIRFLDIDAEYIPTSDAIPLYAMDVTEIPAFRYRGMLTDATYHVKDQVFNAKCRTTHEFLKVEEKYGGTININTDINQTHNNLTYVFQDTSYVGLSTDETAPNNRIKYLNDWLASQSGSSKDMFYYEGGVNYPTDICYSNGINEDGTIDYSTFNTAVAYLAGVKKYVNQNPDADYYVLGQEDIRTCCYCTKCTAVASKYGTTTATIIRFYNAIARAVQEWANESLAGKKVNFMIFSYYFSKEAPVYQDEDGNYVPIDQSVVVADNIIVRFADIVTNYYYSFVEPENESVGYGAEYLKSWQPILNGNDCWYWGYVTNHSYYYGYCSTLHKIRTTLEALEEVNCQYAILQHNTTEYNDWKAIMENYVGAKMLWNPHRDVNELRKEFITLYYGIVAEEVESIVITLDEWTADVIENVNASAYADLFNSEYFPAELWENVYDTIIRAENKINSSDMSENQKEIALRNMQRIKLSPLYSLMVNRDVFYSDNTVKKNAVTKEFFDICSELGVTQYGEHKTISALKNTYPYD